MLIELEVNGKVLYTRDTTTYARDSQENAVIMHMRALVKSKCRKEPWAIFIRRQSKMNGFSKKLILPIRNSVK